MQHVLAEKQRSKQKMGQGDDPGFVHVIDDNETFRKTIEGRLKQFGYEVSTYPSAQHLLDH
jgi:FixJ family two-component response regulator